ncbi:MAG: hypothetical protein KC586_31555, partial [Myxococcales bacterium]|nr:hypothetical protein [Myxococcales bacterium]
MTRMLLLLVAFGLLACGDDDGAESDAAVGDGGEAFDAGPEADAGERDGGSSADGGSDSDGGGADAGPVTLTLPPANGSLDYQLGEAYEPPSGVVVVS